MKIIRCLHEDEFRDIRDGKWPHKRIRVYYGFNYYNHDLEYVDKIASVIQQELPGISKRDMEVYEVTTKASIRHAHFTTVKVIIDAEIVRNNFSNYCIL